MQTTSCLGGEVGDEPGSWASDLLHGQFNPEVAAFVAVVEDGHGPGKLRPLRVIGRVIVTAVVGKLLHLRSEP